MRLFGYFLISFVAGKKIKCENDEWRKGKVCKKLVGYALEHKNLPAEAADYASMYFADLDPKGGVWRNGESLPPILDLIRCFFNQTKNLIINSPKFKNIKSGRRPS